MAILQRIFIVDEKTVGFRNRNQALAFCFLRSSRIALPSSILLICVWRCKHRYTASIAICLSLTGRLATQRLTGRLLPAIMI